MVHEEVAEEGGGLEGKFKEMYREAMFSSRVLTIKLYNLKHRILLQLSLKSHLFKCGAEGKMTTLLSSAPVL